jgi:hypothetical protein
MVVVTKFWQPKASNLQFWLYDKSAVTPWYFWPPPKENSIDRLRSLWVIESKEAPEEESSILKQFNSQKSLLSKAKDFITEPTRDIWDGARILWADIRKIQTGRLDETEWILWKFLKSWEARVEDIQELNQQIDESGWTVFDKIIWTWLNIFWAWVDVTWDVLVSSLKTIAPQGIEDFTKENIEKFAKSDVWQQLWKLIQSWWAKLEQFKNSSPEAWRLVNSVKTLLPLWEVVTWFTGVKIVKETWDVLIDATKQGLKQAWEWLNETIIPWLKQGFNTTKQTVSKFTPDTPWNIAEKISWIDEITKTTLKRADTETFDAYIQAWKEAITDIKNPTPLDLAWDKAISTLNVIKKKRQEIGARKAKILESVWDNTTGTKDIYDDFNNFLSERFNLQINWKTLNIEEIPWKKANIWDSSIWDLQELSNDLLDIFTSDNISLNNLDATVDKIQDSMNFNKLNRVTGNASKTEKQISSFIEWGINQRLKNAAWQEFIDANADFRRIIEMQDKLGRLLGKDLNRGWSLMKAVFSPTDRGTKKLFQEIENEFGIDLTTEAGLAKFAMQVSWDPRQASLLEALDLWTDFTKKLSWKFEWTLLAPAMSAAWWIIRKVFNPEKVWRWLTK